MDALRAKMLARAEELFHTVMALPADVRGAGAAQACGGDAELLDEVLSLVVAAGKTDFLAQPIANFDEVWRSAAEGEVTDPLVGRSIGEYLIQSRLGAGGMGVVYLAQQQNPGRPVALKLMRPGVLSPTLVRRFEHEAEILGRLQHPGIAQIYGAGRVKTEIGSQPYFAMEYVRGMPLLEFSKQRGLSVSERLTLMALICDAVQHAHAKGVIHRDLKPANILVEDGGEREAESGTASGRPGTRTQSRPKILDFGVARMAQADLHLTSHTTAGEIIGTLTYMSPEQVRADPAEIDTRSDVYALGVVMYELLSGRLPIDLKGRSLAEAAPMILETEPRLLGEVDRQFRGDIETIVVKALEKDKSRRYQSAADIAEDIRRSQADAPILARPPTTMYQLRKFTRRNRAVVGGALTAVVLLIVGVVGTSIGLVQARDAKTRAESREHDAKVAALQAQSATDFLVTMLASANPIVSRGRALTVRELVDQAAARVSFDLAEQPEVETKTRIALSRTYLSLNAVESASEQAEKACVLAERTFGTESLEYSRALAVRAAVAITQKKRADALEVNRAVLDLRLRLLPESDPLVAVARLEYARALIDQVRNDEAIVELRLARKVLEESKSSELANCVTLHAEVLMKSMKFHSNITEAQQMLEEALVIFRERGAVGEPHAATVLSSLGMVFTRDRRPAEAERVLKEALAIRSRVFPPGHPAPFAIRLRLINAIRDQDRVAEARDLAVALVDEERKALGTESPDLLNALTVAARLHTDLGECDRAVADFGEAAKMCKGFNNSVQLIVTLQLWGESCNKLKRSDLAEAPLREASEIVKVSGRRGLSQVLILISLAEAVEGQSRLPEAADILGEAHAMVSADAPGTDLCADVLSRWGGVLAKAGKLADAERRYRESLVICQTLKEEKEARAVELLLADVLERQGRSGEAEGLRARVTK